MKHQTLLSLESVYGIYCDAWVVDQEDMLISASFWGRDTSVQEMLARLSLSSAEDGITQLHLRGEAPKTLRIGNPARLDKMTGRMPKCNLFGDMAHVFLFDKAVQKPDFANRRAYMLIKSDKTEPVQGFWQLIKQVCHLPLLEQWQQTILALSREQEWLKVHVGYGLNALELVMPEQALEEQVCRLIQAGHLAI